MHTLGRYVGFSLNPALEKGRSGSSSLDEGLSFYFELGVELTGRVEGDTGFIVNVVDIDRVVLEEVVPVFRRRLSDNFQKAKSTGCSELVEIVGASWGLLSGRFGDARLNRLSLRLNPYREIAIESEEFEMVYYSEKFEFSATHKLWNEKFSPEKNFELFGKCANPGGHGHNYTVEVTLMFERGGEFRFGEVERIVEEGFIILVDHKNLNEELVEFKSRNPTVENIAAFGWEKLRGKFGRGRLDNITVWETEKTYCSYRG